MARGIAGMRIGLAAMAVLAVLLAGCGKKGAPVPAGPPDQVTYPKTYPTR